MNSLLALLAIVAIAVAAVVVFESLGLVVDRRVNPPAPSAPCFDCRRGHHDHDIESGTCRRPDCGCKA